jgi:signal transduction histidine kinase
MSGVTDTAHGRLWPTSLAAASGSLMAALGLTVLAGWFFHIPAPLQIQPQLPPMTRNAAACFLLGGLALLMTALGRPRWPVVACAGIVGVVSVLSLGEYVLHVDFGIDELLGPSYINVKLSSPGRMASATAACFALGSIGLLLAPKILSKRSALLLGINGSIIAAVGIAKIMAFALGSSDDFGWGHVTGVPLHTAFGLCVFGLGMLALAWHVETDTAPTPRWLPVCAAIGVATSSLGLWQALIAETYPPFALLPAAVLGVGCLMALILGLTVYLAQRAHSQAMALRRSEAFLAEAQHLSSTGSFWWRVATDEITWSEEAHRIFGLDQSRPMTPELIRTRVHPEDVPSFDETINRARSAGGDFEHQHRLQMPDRSIKYLRVVAHGTRNNHGQLEYIGAIQDVTDRRLSEEALGKVRSALTHVTRATSLGALTASIAHEVNQPLSGIITNAGTCLRMLSADPPNVEGARETARRTIRDGNRASDVITRLRALFTRKDATTESVDVNDATREVIALSLSELQRNQVILRPELADDLPPVAGDRVQLQQVILNLLRNASDAMSGVDDRPRQLVIRTERDEGDRVRLSVQDAGVGLEPQGVDKLFEAFYTTKSGGMGIGLSVSRSIIESHQGRLWATPNDGPGATFSFSIPCEPEGATRATRNS